MTESRFHEILVSTESLLASEEELDKWREKYPFVSIFQTLKAKALKSRDDLDYDQQLKKAAVASPDREMLYNYLIQPHIQEKIHEIDSSLQDDDLSLKETEPTLPYSEDDVALAKFDVLTEDNHQPDIIEPSDSDSTEDKKQDGLQILEKQFLSEAISASIQQEAIIEIDDEEDNATSEGSVEEATHIIFDDNTSLLEWLKAKETSPKGPIIEETSVSNIIDSFIQKDPQKISVEKEKTPEMIPIDRPKKEFFSAENLARLSVIEDEQFVTETLATIYAKQGHTKKAISAYEKLGLKYPEKRDYFAALIKELKNKH